MTVVDGGWSFYFGWWSSWHWRAIRESPLLFRNYQNFMFVAAGAGLLSVCTCEKAPNVV